MHQEHNARKARDQWDWSARVAGEAGQGSGLRRDTMCAER